jgi:hypothetical protein
MLPTDMLPEIQRHHQVPHARHTMGVDVLTITPADQYGNAYLIVSSACYPPPCALRIPKYCTYAPIIFRDSDLWSINGDLFEEITSSSIGIKHVTTPYTKKYRGAHDKCKYVISKLYDMIYDDLLRKDVRL